MLCDDGYQIEQIEEYLVHFGISRLGTEKQHVIGTFALCDMNGDHKIERGEMKQVIRSAHAMFNKPWSDADFEKAMDNIMRVVDADHVCCFSPSSMGLYFILILVCVLNRVERSRSVNS